MASFTTLPKMMKALVMPARGGKFGLQTLPVLQAVPGSAVIQVLAVNVISTLRYLLSDNSHFTFPNSFVPGGVVIGRVAAVGTDATRLSEGQLVLVDLYVRGRDDPNVSILWGLSDGWSPASKKLCADSWSQAGFAQFARAPLENVHALNERILVNDLGYEYGQLFQLACGLVPYGGFRAINLQSGETVIVAPATGKFSGSAVHVAVAMGARVIAMSRNLAELKRLQASYPPGKIEVVLNTGDVDKDTEALKQFGEVDAFMDLSPPGAAKSTHVRSAIAAVKQHGRVCLMGLLNVDLAVPYSFAMFNNLTIKGQYMYTREDVRSLIRLAESGLFKLGKENGVEVVGKFNLEEIEKAMDVAAANPESGKFVVLEP